MILAVVLSICITGGIVGTILLIAWTYRELREKCEDKFEKVVALSIVGAVGFLVWPLVVAAVSERLHQEHAHFD